MKHPEEVLRIFSKPDEEVLQQSDLKLGSSQFKLPVLLKSAYNQAIIPENKQVLISKGMKESEIDALLTLAESIINQVTVKQNAKKGRTLMANKRITALNLVWEKMSVVCQCAKLLFQNDAVRYNQFLLMDGITTASTPVPVPAP